MPTATLPARGAADGIVDDIASRPTTRAMPFGAIVSLLCVAFGALEAAQSYAGALMRGASDPLASSLIFSGLPWLPAALLAPGVVWVARRVPFDRGHRGRALGLHVVALLAFIALHEVAAAIVVMPWMSIPFGTLVLASSSPSAPRSTRRCTRRSSA